MGYGVLGAVGVNVTTQAVYFTRNAAFMLGKKKEG